MFTTTNSKTFDRLSIVVYGESGSGKTTLTKTLERPLLVSLESGYLSLRDSEGIDVYDVTLDKDGHVLPMDLRFEKLLHGLKLLNTDEMKQKYKWIVIDSLTEVAHALVFFLQKRYPDKRDALVMWGEYNKMITELLKELRDFNPYNILILALNAVEKDESGRRFIGIDMPGKVSARVPALFDECFNLVTFETEDGDERKLITSKHDNCIAKDRSGKLNKFEDADIGAIYNKIFKGEE